MTGPRYSKDRSKRNANRKETLTGRKAARHLQAVRRAKRAPLAASLKALGVTHEAVAARAGCTRTYVAHYFAGRRLAPGIERAILALIEAARAAVRNARTR